jgi:hypothetical protein
MLLTDKLIKAAGGAKASGCGGRELLWLCYVL